MALMITPDELAQIYGDTGLYADDLGYITRDDVVHAASAIQAFDDDGNLIDGSIPHIAIEVLQRYRMRRPDDTEVASQVGLRIAEIKDRLSRLESATFVATGGVPGPKGDDGDKGDKGDRGERGEKGEKGDQGDTGDRGIQGIQGIPGPKGDDGNPGPKGDDGNRGEQGIQGIPGPKGDDGDDGGPGPKGDDGDQGIQGEKGDQGDTGPVAATSAIVSSVSGTSGAQPTALAITPQALTSVIEVKLEIDFEVDNRTEHTITLTRDGTRIDAWADDRNAARTNRVRTNKTYTFFDSPNTADEVSYLFTVPTHSATQDARFEIHSWTVSAVDYVNTSLADLGTGLNQDAVDARVRAGVLNQAETGNTDTWPKDKLPGDVAYDEDVTAVQTQVTAHQRELEGLTSSLRAVETEADNIADAQGSTVSTISDFRNVSAAQLGSAKPLWLVALSAITGVNTLGDGTNENVNLSAGDVIYFPPNSQAYESMFNLGGSGLTAVLTRLSAIEADRWVTSGRIAFGAINSPRYFDGKIITDSHLVDNVINRNVLLANNVVETRNIGADQIERGHLKDNVVGTEELVDGEVTEDKLDAAVKTKLNASGGLTPEQAAAITANTAKVGITTAQAAAITENAANIADLQRGLRVEPNYFLRDATASATRDYIVHVNPAALPSGTTHLGFVMAGSPATARVEVVSSGAYTFTFSAANIQTLSRLGRSTIVVEITFWDAASSGTELGAVSDLIRIRDEVPSGGVEFGSGEGQIAIWSEGDSTDNIPAARLSNIPATKLPFNIVQLTQTGYDALSVKDASTLYVIVG